MITEQMLEHLLRMHVDLLDSDSMVLWAVLNACVAENQRMREELEWIAAATGSK